MDTIAMSVGYCVLFISALAAVFVLSVFVRSCFQEVPAAIDCNATLGVPKRPVIAGIMWALKGGPSAVRVGDKIWDRQVYMERYL